jgi:hypothetical protein
MLQRFVTTVLSRAQLTLRRLKLRHSTKRAPGIQGEAGQFAGFTKRAVGADGASIQAGVGQ